MNTITYQYWFLSNEDMWYSKKAKLIEYFFDSYHIYNASESQLKESGILSPNEISNFLRSRANWDLDKEYEKFMRGPYSFITMEDESYPENLINIADPPYGFFYFGKMPCLNNAVSIVGARRCSAYGKKMATDLSIALGKAGITVISGMARGIDSYAHKGCLEGEGKTIAVLGSGVDVIYPAENNLLYKEISNNGAIISEYPVGTQPVKLNFPRRNRIVAALSQSVIVVEAREKSGSLITADLALDQGKDIYIVPGRTTDALSAGCNRLASQGAQIIYSVEKFIEDIAGNTQETLSDKGKTADKNALSNDLLYVYSLFDFYPKSLMAIQSECSMDYLTLLSNVMLLVKEGLLEEVFKNHFIICG